MNNPDFQQACNAGINSANNGMECPGALFAQQGLYRMAAVARRAYRIACIRKQQGRELAVKVSYR